MIRLRVPALCLGLGLALASASAAPAGKTFAEIAASAKQAYDAARAELAARGAKARAAAEVGDAAKWSPLNEAYVKQLSEMVGICERNVVALTHDATDLDVTGSKPIAQASTQYAEMAGSMETVRLEMIAFGNLVERVQTMDRTASLKALAPKYFVGKP
jgi:hypothetical protein